LLIIEKEPLKKRQTRKKGGTTAAFLALSGGSLGGRP
jgi:hypothetical protein